MEMGKLPSQVGNNYVEKENNLVGQENNSVRLKNNYPEDVSENGFSVSVYISWLLGAVNRVQQNDALPWRPSDVTWPNIISHVYYSAQLMVENITICILKFILGNHCF